MKLLEYQAHQLFAEFHLPAREGSVVSSMEELEGLASTYRCYPAVLKAQVPTGGRGKAGGVKIVNNAQELLEKGKTIFNLTISGYPVKQVFIYSFLEIRQEMYLSIMMNRSSKQPVLIFCAEGGMEINEIALKSPDKIIRLPILPDSGIQKFHVQYIADYSGIPEYADRLFDLISGLYTLFCERNCELAEINPLAISEEGNLVCLDGKIITDDNAIHKHPLFDYWRSEAETDPLILDARSWKFLYIPVSESGNIGVISNGSGMLMSSIDLIEQKGMKVSSVLDLGGGATAERICEAVRIMTQNPKTQLLFVNIFGGITRCDEVAQGIVEAVNRGYAPGKFVLRLEGTLKEEGVAIAGGLSVPVAFADNLVDGVTRIKEMFES